MLIALCAGMAICFEYLGMQGAFAVFKPLTTILIIAYFIKFAEKSDARFYTLMLLALMACLVGDTFLLKEQFFVYGLGAFLVAHLLFTFAFIQKGGVHAKPLVLILILLISSSYFVFLLPKLGEFVIPVSVYFAVICAMAWQGISLGISQSTKKGKLLALACCLFMFSDSMIAFNKFVIPFGLSGLIILSTYWLSITLIADSARTD